MSARIKIPKRSAMLKDLGMTQYQRALDVQLGCLRSKINDTESIDHLLLVEHPPVFTLGKRGGRENLIKTPGFLTSKNISLIQTDRGGNITFHGPGQVVMYPIMDLERARIGVKDFVYGLEEMMGKTVSGFGIDADRDDRNPGLWKGDKKIGSVGISIKKGVCFHGIALNVNIDLTPFSWINPCGLENITMTSIEKEVNALGQSIKNVNMKNVKADMVKHFTDIFEYTILKNEQ
jgi:lipoyl(octanoyl) transferase